MGTLRSRTPGPSSWHLDSATTASDIYLVPSCAWAFRHPRLLIFKRSQPIFFQSQCRMSFFPSSLYLFLSLLIIPFFLPSVAVRSVQLTSPSCIYSKTSSLLWGACRNLVSVRCAAEGVTVRNQIFFFFFSQEASLVTLRLAGNIFIGWCVGGFDF